MYCIANFTATEWNKDILKEKLQQLASLNQEPWCKMYVPTEQFENINVSWKSWYDFTFIEEFENENAFNSHCQEQYVKKFFEENSFLIKESNIFVTKRIWE